MVLLLFRDRDGACVCVLVIVSFVVCVFETVIPPISLLFHPGLTISISDQINMLLTDVGLSCVSASLL